MQTRRWEGILSVYPCTQRGGECVKDNLSTHSQGAEGQLACESINWVCSDEEYELKHHIKKNQKLFWSAISLGNRFSAEDTITPSWTLGCSVTISSPTNFPTGCFAPSGQGRNHLGGGGEGRKGRILLRTPFFYPQLVNHMKDCKHERHEELFCDISKSTLLVDSCTYLQDNIPILLLFGKCCNLGFLSNFLVWPCSFWLSFHG